MWYKTEKTTTILPALAGISFVVFYIVLGYYNRFALDDFYYISLEKQHGIWDSMIYSYNHYTGRWTSLLFLAAALKFLQLSGTLLPYHLFTLFLTFISLFYLIKNVLKRYVRTEINNLLLINYSVLLTAMFFFTSTGTDETWFWITASVHYLWGVIMVCLGTALMIGSSNKVWIYILIILSFLFVGGSNETIVFVTVLLFGISIGIILIKRKSVLKKSSDKQLFFKLFSGLIAITISFYITYKAPGNEVRTAALPENTILNALLITLKSVSKLILFKLPGKIPYFILFALPWLLLGNMCSNNELLSLGKILKQFIYSFASLALLVTLSLFPAAYLILEISPDRALTQVSFYISLFVCVWSFYLGYRMVIKALSSKLLFYLSLLLIICMMSFHICDQLPIVSGYAQEVDKRIALLKELNQTGNTKLVRVKPLPSSGLLLSAEITTDSMRHPNMHLMKGLGLLFYVQKEQ